MMHNGAMVVTGDHDGGLDVYIQDQTSPAVNLFLHLDTIQTTTTSTLSVDGINIPLASVAGITAGMMITVYNDEHFYQSIISNVVASSVNVLTPIDYAFPSGSIAHIGAVDLNVDGSVTPKIAHITVPANIKFDIVSINISMIDDSPMDVSTFGGISALTNGLLFRIVDGIKKNLGTVRSNGEFTNYGCTLAFDDKPPAGLYGVRIRKIIKDINGIVYRLSGESNDEFQVIIRDDLTGLTSLNISINGHQVED